MPKWVLSGLVIGCLASSFVCAAPDNDTSSPEARGHQSPGGANHFNLDVPDHPYDLILARPEKNAVTLSILTYQDMEGSVIYGTQPGALAVQTPIQQFKAGTPAVVKINSLLADTGYFYQFRSRLPGASVFSDSPVYNFHTARSPGSTYTFTLSADAHLDEHTSSQVYDQTLSDIQADKPDFHIDLGNLFMTDKQATREEAAKQYLAQRYYLGQIGTSTPILLALGTHDGESSRYLDGSPDSLGVWSNLIRKRYFPNPEPDGFYTGNQVPDANSGPVEDYYSWEWGDALFVVLDPFRYSNRERGGGDGWGWSLGQDQYQWLKQTLEQSHAKFKLVFIHNLLVGDQASRGGVEVASFNEWGGKNRDGSDGFKDHRPEWDEPVHQLLLKNHVAAVFKAHDNFYARQQLDGIIYNMVPQPSFAGDDRIRDLENYGYKQGVFLGNSGHLRVTVSPQKVTVEYVKSSPQRTVEDSYTINPMTGP